MCLHKIKQLELEQNNTTNKQLLKLAKIVPDLSEDTTGGLQEKWNHLRGMAASLFLSDSNSSSMTTHIAEEQIVEMIMACDAVYYQLYYLQITKHPSLQGDLFIPHPVQYFSIVVDINDFRNLKHSMSKNTPNELLHELSERYGLNLDPATEHPL